MLNAALLQQCDAAIDGVTLGDAAEVDAHAGAQIAHAVMCRVELYQSVVDGRQRPLDLLLGGPNDERAARRPGLAAH